MWSEQTCRAASAAVGRTLTSAAITAAVQTWQDVTTLGLRKTLQTARVTLETLNEHSEALAEEIDNMCIALAVRTTKESRGK